MLEWCNKINLNAALESARAMQPATGSSRNLFYRPSMPISATKATPAEQLAMFREMLAASEAKLRALSSENGQIQGSKDRLKIDKQVYFKFEVARLNVYCASLQTYTEANPPDVANSEEPPALEDRTAKSPYDHTSQITQAKPLPPVHKLSHVQSQSHPLLDDQAFAMEPMIRKKPSHPIHQATRKSELDQRYIDRASRIGSISGFEELLSVTWV
jgi:hypothetical protein